MHLECNAIPYPGHLSILFKVPMCLDLMPKPDIMHTKRLPIFVIDNDNQLHHNLLKCQMSSENLNVEIQDLHIHRRPF